MKQVRVVMHSLLMVLLRGLFSSGRFSRNRPLPTYQQSELAKALRLNQTAADSAPCSGRSYAESEG